MKTIAFLAVTLLAQIAVAANQISSQKAVIHNGEQATVCGVVISAKYATSIQGSPTFLKAGVRLALFKLPSIGGTGHLPNALGNITDH